MRSDALPLACLPISTSSLPHSPSSLPSVPSHSLGAEGIGEDPGRLESDQGVGRVLVQLVRLRVVVLLVSRNRPERSVSRELCRVDGGKKGWVGKEGGR
jgi:hypothetical protein